MHCITERIAAMSFPADGLESAFKNHIDDISATIEAKHSNKVILANLICYYHSLALIYVVKIQMSNTS